MNKLFTIALFPFFAVPATIATVIVWYHGGWSDALAFVREAWAVTVEGW